MSVLYIILFTFEAAKPPESGVMGMPPIFSD